MLMPRFRVLAVLAITLSCVAPTSAQFTEVRTDRANYLIGQITVVRSGMAELDFGFAHGLRPGQKLAVFRSSEIAWSPVGLVELSDPNSNTSRARPVRGETPRAGDLVVVSTGAIGSESVEAREHYYMAHRLLRYRGASGYDTRPGITDARILYERRQQGRYWYRHPEIELRIVYGTQGDEYRSKRVENLVRQCMLFREFQEQTPACINSLSPRWRQVLTTVTGFDPDALPKEDDEEDQVDPDDEFVPDTMDAVEERFRSQPRSVREFLAVMLAAGLIDRPASHHSFARTRLLRSQFIQLAENDELLDEIDRFLNTGG